jgi:hypothetical protein
MERELAELVRTAPFQSEEGIQAHRTRITELRIALHRLKERIAKLPPGPRRSPAA